MNFLCVAVVYHLNSANFSTFFTSNNSKIDRYEWTHCNGSISILKLRDERRCHISDDRHSDSTGLVRGVGKCTDRQDVVVTVNADRGGFQIGHVEIFA